MLLLYHFDYQVGRYVRLERIIEESRETHYETIGDIRGFPTRELVR